MPFFALGGFCLLFGLFAFCCCLLFLFCFLVFGTVTTCRTAKPVLKPAFSLLGSLMRRVGFVSRSNSYS